MFNNFSFVHVQHSRPPFRNYNVHAARILDFQNVLSWASSGVIRSACISLWIPSIYLPLGLFPGTIMSTTALTLLFSSILCMCPYQHSLISLTFSCMLFTPSSFLMSTLYFVSQLYTINSSQQTSSLVS